MKIDLHRHFGGSISPETVIEIQKTQPELKNLVSDIDRLRQIMTFQPGDTNYNFQRFLQKFTILNHIRWNEDSIDIAIENVVRDLRSEGIEYTELRFSIDKYLNHINWDENEAMLFFLDRLKMWSEHYGVSVGPILSVKYETPKKQALRLSKTINHWRAAEQLVGVDFVSDEAFFDPKFIHQISRYWRMCGKLVLAHVGETQSSENVRAAIRMGVDRIAHGISAADDPEILGMANDHGVVFDVSLSSNIKTGVVEDIDDHPVKKLIRSGCKITIGTDDPVTFLTDLDKEYEILGGIPGISEDDVDVIRRNSTEIATRNLKSQK